jgi:hypothetical protein
MNFFFEKGLNLLGIDIIQEKTSGLYSIIDVNYYPGYLGVENFEQKFLEFLLSSKNN